MLPASARATHGARRAGEFGVEVGGPAAVGLPRGDRGALLFPNYRVRPRPKLMTRAERLAFPDAPRVDCLTRLRVTPLDSSFPQHIAVP